MQRRMDCEDNMTDVMKIYKLGHDLLIAKKIVI